MEGMDGMEGMEGMDGMDGMDGVDGMASMFCPSPRLAQAPYALSPITQPDCRKTA